MLSQCAVASDNNSENVPNWFGGSDSSEAVISTPLADDDANPQTDDYPFHDFLVSDSESYVD